MIGEELLGLVTMRSWVGILTKFTRWDVCKEKEKRNAVKWGTLNRLIKYTMDRYHLKYF